MSTVLVIDDDRGTLHLMQQTFRDTGVTVETARTASDGLDTVTRLHPDLVVLDVMLPDISGIEAFQKIRKLDPRLPVIFITAGGTSDTAIEAVKIGAYDYLLKPLDMGRVRELVHQALDMRRRMNTPVKLPGAPFEEDGDIDDHMIGRSPQIMEVYKSIGRVASQDVTVLIRGESGTGKELIARAIYQHSQRSRAPFLAVNCAALPDSLLESELFGHEKGAFTGADRQRIGKFEQCSGGTIFLDEIGDMSPLLQAKLLRLLQEQRFERVGGNTAIQTDVRIIAATHRNIDDAGLTKHFRPDLYYRLNGFTILVPPLRERRDDIELLAEHYFKLYARKYGKDVQEFTPQARQLLRAHAWPGNVRELQSVIRRALLEASGAVLTVEALPAELCLASHVAVATGSSTPRQTIERFLEQGLRVDADNLYAESVKIMESLLFERVLRETCGNRSQASRILGITRACLRNKIRELRCAPEFAPDGEVLSNVGQVPAATT